MKNIYQAESSSSLPRVTSEASTLPENKVEQEQLTQVTGGQAEADRGNSSNGRIPA